MAQIQYSFQRYEKKFVLTQEQYEAILPFLEQYLEPEEYGLHTICNIYFDTEQYDLIRCSIEKPVYKEKFRLRSYGVQPQDGTVYAEIKKKYDGIVYKRRVAAKPQEINAFLSDGIKLCENEQIQREIKWFLHQYRPMPKVFIGYERIAFLDPETDFRVTFDQNIRWRTEDLDLCSSDEGTLLFDNHQVVMEVKTEYAFPLWLTQYLSSYQIYSTSFSKYGTCYQQNIVPKVYHLQPALGSERNSA